MITHDHKGHRQRIRHRVKAEGLDNFHDYQVLEYALSFVIPYKDVNPLAHSLINRFGNIGAVLEADEEALMEIDGMGEVASQFLTSIIKIYNYYEKEKAKLITRINNNQEAIDYAKGLLKGKLTEELILICLTPNNRVSSVEIVAKGTTSEAQVSIRKLTDIISRHKVNNIIVAHNHPKGSATPSPDDDRLTKALVMSMAINEVHVIDHVIIAGEEHYSYRSAKVLDQFRNEVVPIVSKRLAQLEMPYEVVV